MSFVPPTEESARLPPGTLQCGSGSPLVLLHGVLGTPLMWHDTLPLLAAELRVVALPALGHLGGRACAQRPCRIAHVVDDVERSLDALGLGRVHVAGNSMGGWLALELARRGRARSVCALSPAGMWDASSSQREGRERLRATLRLTRWTRPLLPLLARSPAIRRFALRDNARHGERARPEDLVALADAVLACEVARDLLDTPEQLAPLAVDCPVDVVWSELDRIFPLQPFAANARQRVPGARHLVLEGVGHVPMLDNPALVAHTILQTVRRVDDLAAARPL
jgi:pimeloyl-ACP methyl ester carboxylesterase